MAFRLLFGAAILTAVILPTSHGRPQPPAAEKDRTSRIPELLAKRVSLEKAFDGKFKDAIELIAEKYELPLVIDPTVREFAGVGIAECDGLEDKIIRLPKITNIRADTLLKLTCEQADTMYLVYPDYIRIVPTVFALYETGVTSAGLDPNDEQPGLLTTEQLLKSRPLIKRAVVNLAFRNATVADVLDEIAFSSGANVVLAPLVGEKSGARITVRFANTPVDAAVRTVCEMIDLAVIEDANVLVVTTRERAAARLKLEEEKKKLKLLALASPFPGSCIGPPVLWPNWLATASADPAAEMAKLKDQTEQLKKQVDELMKSMKK